MRYYRGLAALAADNLATAEAVFADLAGRGRAGIATDAMVRLGETHERQGRYAAAAAAYTRALAGRPTEPDRLAHKLGVAHERAGDASAAIAAHRRVYFDYPLSPDGEASGDALSRLGALDADFEGREPREKARADVPYGARRWALARTATAGSTTWPRAMPARQPRCAPPPPTSS